MIRVRPLTEDEAVRAVLAVMDARDADGRWDRDGWYAYRATFPIADDGVASLPLCEGAFL